MADIASIADKCKQQSGYREQFIESNAIYQKWAMIWYAERIKLLMASEVSK